MTVTHEDLLGDKTTLELYAAATRALRDAELALKAAQDAYRQALQALNEAIAPV